MKRHFIGLILAVLLFGCTVSSAQTPGERFRAAMKELEQNCSRAQIDPRNTACDILKLQPADPLATPEGRFAHSLKIPNPVPKDSGYKPGMTSQQYFEHLCKTEAGEFIYRTVDNVEGILQMRPREHATDDMLKHLYAMEDPYGHSNWENDRPGEIFINSSGYVFFETQATGVNVTTEAKVKHYSGYSSRWVGRELHETPMVVQDLAVPKTRYGYIWRGITRPRDWELGIVGGEIIIVDLKTQEVLAVQRGYLRSGDVRNSLTGIWWLGAYACPKSRERLFFLEEFLTRVLKPVSKTTAGKEEGK